MVMTATVGTVRRCRGLGFWKPDWTSLQPALKLRSGSDRHRSSHPGGPLSFVGGRSPDFRHCRIFADFLLATPSHPAARSSGLLPLSFRSQWRGPRRHRTGFPHLPTDGCNLSRRENHCQAAVLLEAESEHKYSSHTRKPQLHGAYRSTSLLSTLELSIEGAIP